MCPHLGKPEMAPGLPRTRRESRPPVVYLVGIGLFLVSSYPILRELENR